MTTSSSVNGLYLFSGLPAGVFQVSVDPATLPSGVTVTASPDGGDDFVSVLSPAAGQTLLNANFGFVDPDSLPRTGIEGDVLAGVALLLAAGGWALVVQSRRRTGGS